MTRRLFIVAWLSSCLLCGALSARAEPVPEVFKLGMVAPLTGDFAPYGEHIKKGIELAQLELREKGIPTQIIAEDGCLPTQVRAALGKLTSVDRIHALVGSYCVIGMVASESILQNSKTIGFQTSGGTKEILEGSDYLFTTSAKTTDEAAHLAETAYNKLRLRRAAVLYLTTQWGEEFTTSFTSRFEELGGKIVGTATNPIGQNDFRPELAKLRSSSPDALLIVHLASTLGIAIRQAREAGHAAQLLGTSDGEESSVISQAGSSAEGFLLLAPEPSEETTEMKTFNTAFNRRFGEDPHPLSRHSYDATLLAVSALRHCKSDRECLKERMYSVRDHQGASGPFSINSDGGTNRNFVTKTVRNGVFVRER